MNFFDYWADTCKYLTELAAKGPTSLWERALHEIL